MVSVNIFIISYRLYISKILHMQYLQSTCTCGLTKVLNHKFLIVGSLLLNLPIPLPHLSYTYTISTGEFKPRLFVVTSTLRDNSASTVMVSGWRTECLEASHISNFFNLTCGIFCLFLVSGFRGTSVPYFLFVVTWLIAQISTYEYLKQKTLSYHLLLPNLPLIF